MTVRVTWKSLSSDMIMSTVHATCMHLLQLSKHRIPVTSHNAAAGIFGFHLSPQPAGVPGARNGTGQLRFFFLRVSACNTSFKSTLASLPERVLLYLCFDVSHILKSPHLFGLLAARCFPGSYHPLTIGGETSWCRWQAVSLQGA